MQGPALPRWRAACAPGGRRRRACGEYIPHALAQGCDTFVTSDLRYNDFLDTRGLNLIDAGHFPTEDVVCPEVVHRLQKAFPDICVSKSAVHRDAVQYYMIEGE